MPRPAQDAGADSWLSYYAGQFGARGDKVAQPGDNAPEAQRMAYKEAKDSWKGKQDLNMLFGVVVLGLGAVSLLVTLGSM